MATFRDLLANAKSQIVEIDTATAEARIEAGNVLVLDVREPDEYDEGALADAVHIPRGHLEAQITATKAKTNLFSMTAHRLQTGCRTMATY